MWNGIAIGIGRQRFAGGFADSYSARVLANGGVIESLTCVAGASALLQTASLLLIPSGYKEDVVYAQNPSNGNGDLTFTRASDGFRTNANGQIQRVPWNLVTNSVLAGAVVGNPGTLPTGYNYGVTSGLTARIANIGVENNLNYIDIRYTGTATSTVHTLDIPGRLPIVAGQDVTNSIYVKNVSNAPNISVRVIELNSGGGYVTEGGSSVTLTSNLNRYSYTKTVSGATTTQVMMSFYAVFSSGQTYDFTIRIAAPQMEAGSTASDFFPTTNRQDVPRLSYMYGSCPALLLEPQRTNLDPVSQTFGGAWSLTNSGGVTVSTVSATNPFGFSTVQKVIPSTTLGQHRPFLAANYSASGRIWVIAKADGYNFLSFGEAGGIAGGTIIFNLSNGTISGTAVGYTGEITSLGDGWYKCSLNMIITANISRFIIIRNNNTTADYSGDGTSGILFAHKQMEVGAYDTTAILTTGATATRLADIFTRNNIYTNGLISASGGTWYIELKNNVAYSRDTIGAIWVGDNSTSSTLGNAINIRNGGGGRLPIGKTVGGSFTSLYTTLTDNVKIAVKWNGTTADVFVNGTKVVSATAFTATNMEFLYGQGTDVPKFIQAMALFNTVLSDSDCQLLTT
jgi:hypothetical protein